MGKTLGKMVGAFTILGALIALVEWLEVEDDFKILAQGIVLGIMVVLLPAMWLWDSSFRQLKLERERKKLNLVQQLPSRAERLEELRAEIEALDVELANDRIDLENQAKTTQSMFQHAPDWMKHPSNAAREKMKNELFVKEQEFKKVMREEDRVSKLTDEQWHDEQAAKIYVPD
jgi:hypothetical protein